ncbi:MAG: hypothetical protein V3U16_02160, partial [Candidatus Neomarinimicrobiota bacterium]
DTVDLMKIRSLQAETQQAYEQNALTIEEYSKLCIDQVMNYGKIRNNIEQRAQKLLKGKSFVEIVEESVELIQKMINIVGDVVLNKNIRRNDIPRKVVEEIKKISRINEVTQGGIKNI